MNEYLASPERYNVRKNKTRASHRSPGFRQLAIGRRLWSSLALDVGWCLISVVSPWKPALAHTRSPAARCYQTKSAHDTAALGGAKEHAYGQSQTWKSLGKIRIPEVNGIDRTLCRSHETGWRVSPFTSTWRLHRERDEPKKISTVSIFQRRGRQGCRHKEVPSFWREHVL